MNNLISKLKHRYEKNLRFFEKKAPQLYELAHIQGKKRVEILVTPEGPNLRIGKDLAYPPGKSPEEIGRIQAEDFLSHPRRILFPPRALVHRVDRNSINHEAINQIWDLSENVIKDDFDHDPKFLPLLITFGLGLGYHLQHLLRITEVKYLIIIEEDIELLKATFYTLDWKYIIEYFSRPGRDIFLFINDSAEILYQNIYEAYEKSHHMFGCFSYVWNAFENPLFERVMQLIKQKLFLVLRGWGFFDDEFRSLVQTTMNLLKNIPLYCPQKPVSEKTLAIVVGAGPSLDKNLDFLYHQKDHSVIISCGTAIKTLEREGIVPDFHVNIERPKKVYEILKNTVSSEFLKNTIMVAGNPNWHEFFDLGKYSFMFLKANDAGAALFPKEFPWLYYCNPSVANAGLSFAVYAGFKHIALVGVDLGTPDPHFHHSKYTAYYDRKGPLAQFQPQFEQIVNLPNGQKIFTNSTYLWGKASIEGLLQRHPDIKVYNLGIGLHFEGTIRIESRKFSFASQDKNESIETILHSQIVQEYFPEKIINQIRFLPKETHWLIKKIKKFMDKEMPLENRKRLVDALCYIHTFLFEEVWRRNKALFLLYKGSILHLSNQLFCLSYLIPKPEVRSRILRESRDIFFEFLDRSAKNIQILVELSRNPESLFSIEPNESSLYILA